MINNNNNNIKLLLKKNENIIRIRKPLNGVAEWCSGGVV